MKLRIGDKVEIVQGKSMGGYSWVSEMNEYVGRRCTIRCVRDKSSYYLESGGPYFHEDWLKLIQNVVKPATTKRENNMKRIASDVYEKTTKNKVVAEA